MFPFRRLPLLVIVCWLWPILSYCQTRAPIPRFQTIGVNEGLSQSSVYSILQDKRGFMWFGTGDGLNRYDGSVVQSYHVAAPTGTLPSSFVRGRLCEDDSGNIWFANEHGIQCWNARYERLETRVRNMPNCNGYNNYYTACIKDHVLWMFSSEFGALSWNMHTGKFQIFLLPDSLLVPQGITHFLSSEFKLGKDNSLWFKCSDGGAFYYFDTRNKIYRRGSEPNDAFVLFFGLKRRYLVSKKGINIYDSTSQKSIWQPFNSTPIGAGPTQLVEDRWGRAWLSTFNDGIFCYDNASGQLRHYVHSNVKLASLPTNLVPTLYIDRADNLWAGTDGGGVSRLDLKPPRFHLFPLNEGDYPALSDYFIKCFYEDDSGLLWFGTHSNGFCILNTETGALENYAHYSNAPNSKPIRIVGAIHKDHDGRMWIAHTFGFSLFDRAKKHFEDIPIAPAIPLNAWSGLGWNIYPLKDGRILGGTFAGPVVFSKKNGHWQGRSFIHNSKLNFFITSICQMKDGSIWLATKGPGVLRLETLADSFRITSSFFPGLNVRGLHPDEQNPEILWVTSSNGLAKLNTRTGDYSFKGLAEGMSNAYVYGVLEDQQHNMWMSTNGGLIFYDRKQKHFNTYTYADGLQSNEFNSGAYFKGRSGRMYFGGIRGFNWFNPDNLDDTENSLPGVALLDLRVNGQPLVAAPSLSLPYTQNNIAFRIAVLDYSRPEANRVAYYMQGWDKGWIENQSQIVHYSNLPPGSYKLRVKGCNAAGIWSAEQSLDFKIRAPFWESTLFYILLCCLAAGIIALAIRHILLKELRAQKRVIERQKMLMEERARISKDMHDEIGSGLTRIAMMSESLHHPNDRIEEAKKISGAARSLSQSMSEIIWALNPSHDTLESLLSYLREQINSFLEPFSIDYTIIFPDEPPELSLSNVQRRNLYLTTKESVGNVLKHAGAKTLRITAKLEEGILRFEVCDDGKGFCREPVRRSANGLRNMQRRMEDIGGFFDCTSDSSGTVIYFGMPLKRCKKNSPQIVFTTFFTLWSNWRKNIFGG